MGGTTFARNRAGIYTRARVAPTQPRTDSQQANRAAFATLTQQWRTLTTTQIAGWNSLASSVTLTDTLGHSYMPSGMQLFISCNRNLGLIGATSITEPPVGGGVVDDAISLELGLLASGGILTFAEVAIRGYTEGPFPPFTISATGMLSPGITFIARHLYRQMPPPITSTPGAFFFSTQWGAQFGSAQPGAQIGVRVQYIDPLTGFAGLPATTSGIIG